MSYKSNVNKKFGAVAICFVLVGVILCGMMTSWFTDWNPYCWFGHEYTEEGICAKCGAEQPIDELPADEDNVIEEDAVIVDGSAKVYAMTSQMIFGAPLRASHEFVGDIGMGDSVGEGSYDTIPEQTVTVKAVVRPDNAVNNELEWSLAWTNADSTWAKGKTLADYVTIEQSQEDGSFCTVTVKQPFGEQIKLRCSAKDNPVVYGETKLDYIKRLTNISIGYTRTFNVGSQGDEFDDFISVTNHSVGTILGNFEIKSLDFLLTDFSKVNLSQNLSRYNVDDNVYSIKDSITVERNSDGNFVIDSLGAFVDSSNSDGSNLNNVINLVNNNGKDTVVNCIVVVNWEYSTADGNFKQSGSLSRVDSESKFEFTLNLDAIDRVNDIEDITIENDSYVF